MVKRCVPLEPAAEEVSDQSIPCPRIYQLPPQQGRQKLEEVQSTPVYEYSAAISEKCVDTGEWGEIRVFYVQPEGIKKIRNIIYYIHGGGWVFGSFHTHEKLVRELAARTDSLVVFPEYSRAPEAKYPVAMEQCYFLLASIRDLLENEFPGVCSEPLIVAGDSAGGTLAIAMIILKQQRGGPEIEKLLLYYPVTNACFRTPSYCRFAENYYLYRAGMMWFWQQYAPLESDRRQITASPLRADLECLKSFPDTMIINGQADVLCSEGEAFGEKLQCAGVKVTALQIQGTIHDFVMLNALNQTQACRIAMDASTAWICRKSPAFAPSAGLYTK